MIDAFDPPDVMTSCPRRFETTVPTQALALLNSAVSQSQAREFAHRLNTDCGGELSKIPTRAWLLAFNRPITHEEDSRALEFLRNRESALRETASATGSPVPFEVVVQNDSAISTNSPRSASQITPLEPWVETALTEFCLALFNANEFVFID
jgi:hypothetical protein